MMGLYAKPALLAEPEWLLTHGDQVRIIDCRPREFYEDGHIPGAVHLPLADSLPLNIRGPWIKDPADPARIMPTAQFDDLMQRLGVSSQTTVVAYSDAVLPPAGTGANDVRMMFSTRLWWVLNYYGHTNVRVLNGGFRRWAHEGGPVVREVPTYPAGDFRGSPRPEMACSLTELRSRYRDSDLTVVSVLPRALYDGSANRLNNTRVGHIPGSIHLDLSRFVDETGSFKSGPALEELIAAAGIPAEGELVVHCQAGIRSSLAVFALGLLDRPGARIYEGGMWEWANRSDAPLELIAGFDSTENNV
jgi:thiosulfate/3-mercaptopyruvate sulfurtransferase